MFLSDFLGRVITPGMNLESYFSRISFRGKAVPDLTTLNKLMDRHIRSIPFENLDVFSERGVSSDLPTVFDKIVTQMRGGWCYEMNGLFEWVLREVGFDVERLSAGVRRAKLGQKALGNHLCLMVTLDQPYLVDVGFGSSQLYALPIVEEVTTHRPLQMALVKADDGFWRLHEGGPDSITSFDFKPGWCDEDLLAACHDMLVENPETIFRKTMVAKIRSGDDFIELRGRALEIFRPGRKEKRMIESAKELGEILHGVFGLTEPDIERLWPIICERHLQLFPHEEGGRLA